MSVIVDAPEFRLRAVDANGVTLNVATAGSGPPLLLLHGWPHTWALWARVMPALARAHFVIAPDLRGLGGSTKASDGYDLETGADDMAALLDALGQEDALVVGIDLGAPVAWMLAMRHPGKARRLAVMESLLGDLPGAERFLAPGPPWWFGFHAVPDLPETVLVGHEAEYLDWFYRSGRKDGRPMDRAVRDAFVAAYTGREALRCSFAYYRALRGDAAQVRAVLRDRRVTVPTLAISGGVVGDALYRQLEPIADALHGCAIADCGHIIPLEQPDALAAVLLRFSPAH